MFNLRAFSENSSRCPALSRSLVSYFYCISCSGLPHENPVRFDSYMTIIQFLTIPPCFKFKKMLGKIPD